MSLVQHNHVEDFLSDLSALGRQPATLSHHRYVLKQAEQTEGDLTKLTKQECRAYVRLLSSIYEPGGVKSRLKSLRAFGNWAIEEGLQTENHWRSIDVKVEDRPQLTATDAQIEQMLDACKGPNRVRDLALLSVLADTGCRKGEVAALLPSDIDLDNRLITFRVSKSQPRIVPMSARAHRNLRRWVRVRGDAKGSLWSVGDPYSLVKAVVARRSAGTLTPHSMRRAFAVRWLLNGGTESGLMRIAGWSSRGMIQTYIRASADGLAHEEFARLID